MLYSLILAIFIRLSESILRDFSDCHDDTSLKPKDGMLREHTFTWLGFAQYMHVTTGLTHHSRAPRVVLVHRQFALGTAQDLFQLPKNYKLGNVIFGDYDRDEEDCGLKKSQIKIGIKCGIAYIELPIVDIVPHPEFTRFGVGNSIVLIKFIRPIKSHYVVPICLPSYLNREVLRRKRMVFLIDYITMVPIDFESERLAKKTLKVFTHRECRRHRMRSRLGSEGVTHVLCTSGCGVRSGAPIISHSVDGTFELVGLNAGGGPCRRRYQRRRLNAQPPIYIDVYPYIQWISNVVTAHVMPRPYPDNLQLTDSGGIQLRQSGSTPPVKPKGPKRSKKEGWRSRTYVSGRACYSRLSKFNNLAYFFDERFEVNADPPAKMNIFMRVIAGYDITITCVKINLPNRLVEPEIRGVKEYNVSIEMTTDWFPYTFLFAVSMYGRNSTQSERDQWQDWAYYGRS